MKELVFRKSVNLHNVDTFEEVTIKAMPGGAFVLIEASLPGTSTSLLAHCYWVIDVRESAKGGGGLTGAQERQRLARDFR